VGARLGVPVSRGDPFNVVAQMDQAVRTFAPDATHVARALADNPLVDVALADWRLDVLRETGADGLWYGGQEDRITYAGTTDVWSRSAWDLIAKESSGSQLEHPGQAYWDHLSRYNVVQLPMPRAEYLQPFKTELDEPADLKMFQELWRIAYGGFRAGTPLETLLALKVLAARPDVAALNAGVPVKTQSRALWPNHFKPWICDNCKRRGGSLVQGNLRVFCANCGRPHTYYGHKPERRSYAAE
jgi:spore coat polysaccharide biosynthesis protein SpsF (cytidylyltransferase family)